MLTILAFVTLCYGLWLIAHQHRLLQKMSRNLTEARDDLQQTQVRLEDMSNNFFSLAASYSSLAAAHSDSLTNERAAMARTRRVLELGEQLLRSVSQTAGECQPTGVYAAYQRDPNLVKKN